MVSAALSIVHEWISDFAPLSSLNRHARQLLKQNLHWHERNHDVESDNNAVFQYHIRQGDDVVRFYPMLGSSPERIRDQGLFFYGKSRKPNGVGFQFAHCDAYITLSSRAGNEGILFPPPHIIGVLLDRSSNIKDDDVAVNEE